MRSAKSRSKVNTAPLGSTEVAPAFWSAPRQRRFRSVYRCARFFSPLGGYSFVETALASSQLFRAVRARQAFPLDYQDRLDREEFHLALQSEPVRQLASGIDCAPVHAGGA